MTRELKIKAIKEEILIEGRFFMYIYPKIYNFLLKLKLLDFEINNILIRNQYLNDFSNEIQNNLLELLNLTYNEPKQGELQNHPSRFEKIIIDDKIYKVNYRMSINGQLAYSIYCLFKFIKNAEITGDDLFIVGSL